MNLPGEDNADCIDIITGIKNEAALSKMPSPRTHMLQKGFYLSFSNARK